jgi:signal transduction histidine kinase
MAAQNQNGHVSEKKLAEVIDEIKSPLNAIRAWAGVLATESCEEVRFQGLKAIETRAQEIEQKLNDMLKQVNYHG